MRPFHPDLIIEATSVCDRACNGCYAPNVVSRRSPEQLYRENPRLFLNPARASAALGERRLGTVAIRGGEPTRHPELAAIIGAASTVAERVILETHGRWILPPTAKEHSGLLSALAESQAIVKLSFDKMHVLSVDQLRMITQVLERNGIPYLVAITAQDENEFRATRHLCNWIADERFIFQKIATTESELIRPVHGVLGVDGRIRGLLSTRSSFQTDRRLAI